MTEPEAEYGDRLRRALHAAADGVVPSGDGLERIRHRIAQEQSRDSLSLLLGWLKSSLLDFRYLIGDLRSVMPPVATTLKEKGPPFLAAAAVALKSALLAFAAAVISASRAARRSGVPAVRSVAIAVRARVPERLRESDGWLRPVLATAGAVLVAVAVMLAIPGIRQNIMPSGNVTSPPKQGPGGPGGPDGTGTPQSTTSPAPSSGPASPSPSATRHHKRTAVTRPTCAQTTVSNGTTICVSATPVPSTSPVTSTSPSPSPTPSPTNSPTPSPTPTDSSTPSTQGSGSGTGSTSTTSSTGQTAEQSTGQ